jgi:hypothetical protein
VWMLPSVSMETEALPRHDASVRGEASIKRRTGGGSRRASW